MPDVIISDTSCLILFSKINRLDLLKGCYNKILVTPEIAFEFGDPLTEWLTISEAKDKRLQKTLEKIIGKGGASAIALAFEFKVLLRAKEFGIIASVKRSLDKLAETDFRISDKILKKILEIAGEN